MILSKKILRPLFALTLFASVLRAQDAKWVRVAPMGAGFSVVMPIRPTEAVDPGEAFTSHAFSVVSAQTVFVVAYFDYVPDMKIDEAKELIANRESFVKGVKAKLVSTKEISLAGRPGLEFTAENDNAVYKSRVYIRGHRVHQVATVVMGGKDDTKRVDRFFASFALTEDSEPNKP